MHSLLWPCSLFPWATYVCLNLTHTTSAHALCLLSPDNGAQVKACVSEKPHPYVVVLVDGAVKSSEKVKYLKIVNGSKPKPESMRIFYIVNDI